MEQTLPSRAVKPVPEPDSSDDCLSFSSDEEFEGAQTVRAIPASSALNRPSSVWAPANVSPNTYLKTAFSKDFSDLPKPAKPLTFDAFLQVIEAGPDPTPTEHRPSKPAVSVPKRAAPVRTPNKDALQKAKELARAKEALQQQRKIAVINLQRWWRRVRCCRAIARSLLFTRLRREMWREARGRWIRELKDAAETVRNARIQATQMLLARYKNACAATIQLHWRAYKKRQASKRQQALQAIMSYRRSLLLAYAKGWKTRRVMSSWPIRGILERLQDCEAEDRPLLVTELVQTFREEYRGGRWMRQRRVEARERQRRKPSEVTASSHSPVRITGLRLHSPQVSIETMSSTPSAKSLRPNPIDDIKPFKPFLKRKTQAIAMQKVNWAGVKTKVNCWGAPEAQQKSPKKLRAGDRGYTRNSVEEFVAIERMSIKPQRATRKESKSIAETGENRSNSLPQKLTSKVRLRSAAKVEPTPIQRLSTIRSAEDSDEGDVNIFSTFDVAPTRQVRLKRKPADRGASVEPAL